MDITAPGVSLHPLCCYRLRLLSFIEGTTDPPVTTDMDRVTITTVLTGRGSRATGGQGGLPMVGGEVGFRVIGGTALISQRIAKCFDS
jgi:hypothetical protein